MQKTGKYGWVDGWPVTYTSWATFEPNGDGENCVKVTQEAEWKTDVCEEARPFICRTTTGTCRWPGGVALDWPVTPR